MNFLLRKEKFELYVHPILLNKMKNTLERVINYVVNGIITKFVKA